MSTGRWLPPGSMAWRLRGCELLGCGLFEVGGGSVALTARAPDSKSGGWGFESLRARQYVFRGWLAWRKKC